MPAMQRITGFMVFKSPAEVIGINNSKGSANPQYKSLTLLDHWVPALFNRPLEFQV
jgi:hypothetical protein